MVYPPSGDAPTVKRVNPSPAARERAIDKIARLSAEPQDLVSFWRASAEVLDESIRYQGDPCWFSMDPTSLLLTSHFNDSFSASPEWGAAAAAAEFANDGDVNKLTDIVKLPDGVQTLYEATGGNPASSARWHRNMEIGSDQEMLVRLRARSGEVWGAVGFYREPGQPLFDEDDKRFARALAPHLADGARRALLVGEAKDPEGAETPGLVIVNDRWEIESITPAGRHWVGELPDGDWDAGHIPSAVLAIVAQAKRTAQNPHQPGQVAIARVLTRSGTWVVLHGASLVTDGSRRVAVIVERAHAAEIYPLLMSAYGLTERERDVVQHILQGESTARIAQRLVVSAHTVQQHLKSIFDKTGVHSRRDLVAKVFFTHYEPRVRDNEYRATVDKPFRGGPKTDSPAPRMRQGAESM